MLVYLSGAIEYAPDHGKAWRSQITPFLHEIGWRVYDPALDEKKGLFTDEEVREFRSWKKTDLLRFQQTVRKIIAYDIDWIERRCDCVIAYWDEHAGHGAGTQAELSFAHRRGIPVYLVCAVPVEEVSGWVLGCATEVFDSFESLMEFLTCKHATPIEAVTPENRELRTKDEFHKGQFGLD